MPDDFQNFVHPEKAEADAQLQQRCMNPVEAVRSCLKKYATFRGRATRAEYWWFWLFNVILNVILQALSEDMPESQTVAAVTGIITLALFLPGIAACCRRLHDRDHTGWWQLIAFTIIGLIPLLIMLCRRSQIESNRYGEIPCVIQKSMPPEVVSSKEG